VIDSRKTMDISDIEKLNILWEKIYPYLADQVKAILPKGAGRLLEIGPFSGGIAFELAKTGPDYSIVIADCRDVVLDYLRRETRKRGLLDQVEITHTDLVTLTFGPGTFDGVIFRGAFFFLDAPMLREIYRVLRPGGVGFVGGGFGSLTPESLIEEIASESRELNARLGRKWISRKQLEEMVADDAVERSSRIIEEGGLWVVLRK
jgi:ubiquinone/menaquinone biosynthesis C-methylase UbiE